MLRVQFQIRGLMLAVAMIAVLFSLKIATIGFLIFYGLILAVTILTPAIAAPPKHRVEAACWAIVVHPLILLVWLLLWRIFICKRPLYPDDKNMIDTITMKLPYAIVYLSRFYLPLFAFIGCGLAVWGPARRNDLKPLLFTPIVFMINLIMLKFDYFKLSYWFWD